MQPADGRVVSNFIVAALRGEPLTIHDGWHTRSFCYVSDTIDALVRLMEAPSSCAGPVNVGNPAEFTVLELAERVRRLTGSVRPDAARARRPPSACAQGGRAPHGDRNRAPRRRNRRECATCTCASTRRAQ